MFLIADGKTYEMAPKTWSGGNPDPRAIWCNNSNSLLPGSFGTAIGKGAQNTVLMDTGCTSGAGQQAADYTAGGKSDWFLPSKDELNAMWLYSQVGGFNTATYGFAGDFYWSSSQGGAGHAWYQKVGSGSQYSATKGATLRVRPVRAF